MFPSLIPAALAAILTAMAGGRFGPRPPIANGGDYVCAPRLQLRQPQLCPQHGPGARMVELARAGLYAPKPLPIVDQDPGLGFLPFDYVSAGADSTPLYSSLDDAFGGGGGSSNMAGGFVYFAYYDRYEQGGSAAYRSPSGYLRGSDVSRVQLPGSPGLQFSRNPDRPFAWVIAGGTCTANRPGGPPDFRDGRCFTRHSVVQIYGKERLDDLDWYLVGQDQWIEQRLLSIVDPDPTPPPGVEDDRWVTVNLYEQTVEAYEGGRLVFATTVSTGRNGFWTQPGLFQVWAKLELDNMSGGIPGESDNYYFLENVPWVLYFDQSRALHGTYWHSRFGTPTSRGCVNLAPADANWIFNFAEEGTSVYVVDPSGNTPTDPALYGPGGA